RRSLARTRPTRLRFPETALCAVSCADRRDFGRTPPRRHNCGDGVTNRGETKLAEQTRELLRRATQSAVVSHARMPRHGQARLGRIELPRMDIEGARYAALLRLTKRGLYDAIGQQPEVRAARGG